MACILLVLSILSLSTLVIEYVGRYVKCDTIDLFPCTLIHNTNLFL